MTDKELLEKKRFVVVGDTLNEEKYAYRIKKALLDNGYSVSAVGKELSSLNDVDTGFDVLDLCINPLKGLSMLKECKKNIPFVLIQPGAGSDDIEEYLKANNIAFKNGCILKALENR